MPIGVMTVQPTVMPTTAVVGVLALAATVMAIRSGGWLGWTIGIVLALVAIAGLGFVGFAMWGKFAGFPWGFGFAG